MIAHQLRIGQTIYDIYDGRWGEILLINGKDEDSWVYNTDDIILYKPVDSEHSQCECLAREAYPLMNYRSFWGEDVCMEINVDEFDDDHDYEYFCPNRNENCWEFEVVKED